MKKMLVILISGILLLTPLYAHKHSSEETKDTTKSKVDDDFDDWNDFKTSFMERPTLMMVYSWNKGDYNKDVFTKDFETINSAEIRLGWTKQKTLFIANNIVKIQYPYTFFNFM